MRRTSAPVAAAVAVLVATSSTPSLAQEGDGLDAMEELWLDEALLGVADELSGLDDLDAVVAEPDMVAVVALVDADRVEDVAELLEIDAENLLLLESGRELGFEVPGAAASALAPLDDDVVDAAVVGDRSVDPGPWLDAMVSLLETYPEFEGVELDRTMLEFALADLGFGPAPTAGDAAPTTALPGSSDGAGAPASAGGAPADAPPTATTPAVPGWVPAAGLVLVLVVLAAMLVGRRRRDADHDAAPAMEAVLEASRRMTAALDADQVHRIALRAAVDLTDADAGGFVLAGGAGSERWGSTTDPDRFLPPDDDEGLVARALSTGQTVSGPVADEPWLDGDRGTTVVTPVIVQGRTVGAMVVVRDDGPFRRDVREQLGMLSPVTGSAISAATTHRGAIDASFQDALTGLPNRRRLDADLSAIGAGARFAMAMVDVDHFKTFNDTHGHAAGDLALQMVARALEAAVRADDTVYRYGGEEFCVLLPRADEATARRVVERVRARVGSTLVPGGETQPGGRVTVSLGVAVRWGAERPSEILQRADTALYEAKRGGRDRAVVA